MWVLTGDKIETAINIGFSSGLLDNGMIQYLITSNDNEELKQQLKDSIDGLLHDYGVQKISLIVGGEPLLKIFNNESLK